MLSEKESQNQSKKFDGATKKRTAEEAIDSKWLIGSPTNLTAFLKYKS